MTDAQLQVIFWSMLVLILCIPRLNEVERQLARIASALEARNRKDGVF